MGFISTMSDYLQDIDPLLKDLHKDTGKLFKPKGPAPEPKGPDEMAIANAQNLAAQETTRRLSRGRTSTILTSGRGLSDMGTTSKYLLGQ